MKMVYSLPVLAILLATAMSSIFVVDVREKVLILQFGEVKQVVDEPGLYFKAPFIQEVFRYDDRILGLVTDPTEITFADQRRLVVDAFARWRIVDLQKFRRAVGLGGIDEAQQPVQDREPRSARCSRLGSLAIGAVRGPSGSDEQDPRQCPRQGGYFGN